MDTEVISSNQPSSEKFHMISSKKVMTISASALLVFGAISFPKTVMAVDREIVVSQADESQVAELLSYAVVDDAGNIEKF
ncbi:hypothetical protein J2S37_001308 [Corynebacterium felinum]|uniref:Uncharacterized protein n=1 Tax=Corynebacterium felinum TaxID=131318 RepID=A0ABU2B820_9CORY|nr:hypothetical protein [Corynebacterium felinum]